MALYVLYPFFILASVLGKNNPLVSGMADYGHIGSILILGTSIHCQEGQTLNIPARSVGLLNVISLAFSE